MYHFELRQFPHSAWRFNLSDDEMQSIVEPWAREQIVEVGERKWSPHTANITILQGPQLDIAQLSMGRGWRAAQRQSEDVTERVLEAAREAARGAAEPTQALAPGVAHGDPLALGVQIAALLGHDPMGLLDAWRAAAAGSPGLAPSESLALAEHALRSPGGKQG
jgi:hypothetical protein